MNRRLLWLAKIRAKENDYKFVWTSEGKVFVRKQAKASAIRIATENDLSKIV